MNPGLVVCAFEAEAKEGQTERDDPIVRAVGTKVESAILKALELLTGPFD